ncbi:MAG: N-formylglutamate amidohydrolase [Rhizobiales bacterium]|nr:N-formylglutamate amidohydrolase [Hyphomicrobiales bacterium]
MPADDVLEIIAPAEWTVPMVYNSPHSGNVLPGEFLSQVRLDKRTLRLSQDCFVDELFGGCITAGAPMLRALHSRSYIDLNREPYELDPRMFADPLPGHFNTGSPRVACGLGTLPRIVAEGQEIYHGRLRLEEALKRIENIYRPYHRALAALLNEAHQATGHVLLVDCHSMPSSAVDDIQGPHERRIDVVLGDRFAASCAPEFTDIAEHCLTQAGLNVVRNRPYAGGFFTENHGRPRLGRHALQVEVNRSLYMDEGRQIRTAGFAALKSVLDNLSRHFSEVLSATGKASDMPMAAE